MGDGGREREMEMVILQQDALIKVLQTQCWELLKKSGDDVQTWITMDEDMIRPQ